LKRFQLNKNYLNLRQIKRIYRFVSARERPNLQLLKPNLNCELGLIVQIYDTILALCSHKTLLIYLKILLIAHNKNGNATRLFGLF